MSISMVKAFACSLVASSWCADSGLTESLRLAAVDWDIITQDPFTDALAAGTLPNATLTKYLVQDYRFLDAFVVLLASTIAIAPTLQDRLPASRFLGLITSQENTYFERSFQALGVTEAEMSVPDEPETKAFVDLMLKAARSGELGQMLAVLVVAEWSYLTWGERVTPAPDLAFYHLEWIDLHRGPHFRSVVEFFRGLLDKVGLTLDEAQLERTKAAFLEAVQCEKGFWAMAHRQQKTSSFSEL